jgi:predicted nucleotidyltransferase
MPNSIPGAPGAVAAALDRLKDELTAAAQGNLAGLILYGGLARGRYRPGKSDINLIVLLHDASAAALAAIAPALRTARRAAGVDPLLLTPAEVARVADAFPTKFLDIKNHHIVLAGTDPFAELEVSRERIRLRVEQELRNLLLRLRHSYVAVGGGAAMLTRALARVARPLALGLQALLQLAGKEAPDRSADIFEAAVAAFGLEPEPLARLAELRQDTRPTGDVAALYQGVLAAVARAADSADEMKEPRP